jgi:hypothetical protein
MIARSWLLSAWYRSSTSGSVGVSRCASLPSLIVPIGPLLGCLFRAVRGWWRSIAPISLRGASINGAFSVLRHPVAHRHELGFSITLRAAALIFGFAALTQ